MQYKLLLPVSEDVKKVEFEEKFKFIKSILEALSVPIDFWDSDEPLSIEQKKKLREVLSSYNITISDSNTDGMNLYHSDANSGKLESTLIATWEKPNYIIKKDYSQIDKSKQVYVEMTISFSSIFDEE